jgi:hypothetical protein
MSGHGGGKRRLALLAGCLVAGPDFGTLGEFLVFGGDPKQPASYIISEQWMF